MQLAGGVAGKFYINSSNFFGDVRPFLAERHFSPRTCQHLIRILDDEGTCQSLKLELAVCNDGAEPFVKKTYLMEGDSDLSYHAYQWLQEVITAVRQANHPNVEAVAKEIAQDDQSKCQELLAKAKQCIQPAFQYFQHRFCHISGDQHNSIGAIV